MGYLKQIGKRIPFAGHLYRFASDQWLRIRTPADIFTDIYRGNKWVGTDSVSGPGSGLWRTRIVRNKLTNLCRCFAVRSMLDIPCGDFHWMKHVDLDGVDYTGADIVADLIRANGQYEAPNIRFLKLNLIEDRLPKVDLVFCRDCLVHLSFRDALAALHAICSSGSTYLLTTTFTSRPRNCNIVTGQWRPLNLEVLPFSFPPPLQTINEERYEDEGEFSDKSLGLWRVEDIAQCLANQDRRFFS
jgi:hypothetical protein